MIDIPLTDKEAKSGTGKLRTASLFYETNTTEFQAYFTTKDYHHTVDGYEHMSLKALYMEIADVTEYKFALAVFGRWKTWERIAANKLFHPIVEEWRFELELKLRSEGIDAIKDIALTDGAKGMAAAKYLADRGWDVKRGRPSKAEVARERKAQSFLSSDTADDAKRIGITRH